MKYFRKSQFVEAKQVDLSDILQLSRLKISCYETSFGKVAHVQVDALVRARANTGDWMVVHEDGTKEVVEDAEFKKLYLLVSVPEEAEFGPEAYQKLLRESQGATAEIRRIEDADKE